MTVCKFPEGCHRVAECDPGCGVPVVVPESDLDRLHRQLVAARAEADGWAEALRNSERLYDQHLAEVRATEGEAARRLSADGVRRVAAQSGWSGWAADYIHPDIDFDNNAVEAEHRAREMALHSAILRAAADAYDEHHCAESGSKGLRLPCEHTLRPSEWLRARADLLRPTAPEAS